MEGEEEIVEGAVGKKPNVTGIVVQIILLDIIFSFDSILTAIGLADQLYIMIAAVVISMFIMLLFSEFVSKMIDKYPTIKNLALCFLILVGFVLLLDGVHIEVPKNMVYIAIAFGLGVEILNIISRNKNKSNTQIKTEYDFNKFAADYELMSQEEKKTLRDKLTNWVSIETNKSADIMQMKATSTETLAK